MCAILLVAVGIVILWIFKYDDWYPNPINAINKSEHTDTGVQDVGIGAE